MDRLIYNIIRGFHPNYDEIHDELKEQVDSLPFFMVGDDGKVHFSPDTVNLLTVYLYSEINKFSIYRNSVMVDQVTTANKVLQANEKHIEQKIYDGIVNFFTSLGLTENEIAELVDMIIKNRGKEKFGVQETNHNPSLGTRSNNDNTTKQQNNVLYPNNTSENNDLDEELPNNNDEETSTIDEDDKIQKQTNNNDQKILASNKNKLNNYDIWNNVLSEESDEKR